MYAFASFLETLDIKPIEWSFYEEALTHRSFVKKPGSSYNERLEFLGDRVLGLVMATWLFQKFKDASEGDLAKRQAVLVSKEILLQIAYDINLPPHLFLSPALKRAALARVESLYANAVEALIAALYLDQGLERAESFIQRQWQKYILQVQKAPKDPKSELQEWAQAKGLPRPSYDIIETLGPDHAPEFKIRVTLVGFEPEIVQATARRKGEHSAAKNLLKRILYQK